jgi:hypothetical protein
MANEKIGGDAFRPTESIDRSANYKYLRKQNSARRIAIEPAYYKTPIGRKLKKYGITLRCLQDKIVRANPKLGITLADLSNYVHNRKANVGIEKRDAIKNYLRLIRILPPAKKPVRPHVCKCPRCGARHYRRIK